MASLPTEHGLPQRSPALNQWTGLHSPPHNIVREYSGRVASNATLATTTLGPTIACITTIIPGFGAFVSRHVALTNPTSRPRLVMGQPLRPTLATSGQPPACTLTCHTVAWPPPPLAISTNTATSSPTAAESTPFTFALALAITTSYMSCHRSFAPLRLVTRIADNRKTHSPTPPGGAAFHPGTCAHTRSGYTSHALPLHANNRFSHTRIQRSHRHAWTVCAPSILSQPKVRARTRHKNS